MKGTSGTAVLLPAKWKLKASYGLFTGNAEGAGSMGGVCRNQYYCHVALSGLIQIRARMQVRLGFDSSVTTFSPFVTRITAVPWITHLRLADGEIQVCLRSTRSSKQSKTLNSAEHPYLRTRRCSWQAGWWATPCGLKA